MVPPTAGTAAGGVVIPPVPVGPDQTKVEAERPKLQEKKEETPERVQIGPAPDAPRPPPVQADGSPRQDHPPPVVHLDTKPPVHETAPQVIIHNHPSEVPLAQEQLPSPTIIRVASPPSRTDPRPPVIELADPHPPVSPYATPLTPGTAPQTVINIGDAPSHRTRSESPTPRSPPSRVRVAPPHPPAFQAEGIPLSTTVIPPYPPTTVLDRGRRDDRSPRPSRKTSRSSTRHSYSRDRGSPSRRSHRSHTRSTYISGSSRSRSTDRPSLRDRVLGPRRRHSRSQITYARTPSPRTAEGLREQPPRGVPRSSSPPDFFTEIHVTPKPSRHPPTSYAQPTPISYHPLPTPVPTTPITPVTHVTQGPQSIVTEDHPPEVIHLADAPREPRYDESHLPSLSHREPSEERDPDRRGGRPPSLYRDEYERDYHDRPSSPPRSLRTRDEDRRSRRPSRDEVEEDDRRPPSLPSRSPPVEDSDQPYRPEYRRSH